MERRRHPRILLKAYGAHHVCVVRDLPFAVGELSRNMVEVILIDISPGGARLRCKNPDVLHKLSGGVKISLNPCFAPGSHLPETIPSKVRWKGGDEFGIQFVDELDAGVADLQRLLQH